MATMILHTLGAGNAMFLPPKTSNASHALLDWMGSNAMEFEFVLWLPDDSCAFATMAQSPCMARTNGQIDELLDVKDEESAYIAAINEHHKLRIKAASCGESSRKM
jgi:hypothetical protein